MRKLPSGADLIRTDTTNAFAHHTMGIRVPGIIRNIIKENLDLDTSRREELEDLIAGLESDGPIPPLELPAPDRDLWSALYAEHRGETWLGSDWFFAETYVYRLVMQAVRHWETGFDPFHGTKRRELESPGPWRLIESSMARLEESGGGKKAGDIGVFLHAAVWGNRIDLSYEISTMQGSDAGEEGHLLIDHTGRAADNLSGVRGSVSIVTDNAGSELAADLLLAEMLLRDGGNTVVLHVKQYPTYVSDATAHDVYGTILYMRSHFSPAVSRLGDDLYRAFQDRRLVIAPDLFWNSGYFLGEAPERIAAVFRDAGMVIFKGDMNYRRVVFDTIWGGGSNPDAFVPEIGAPILLLRTMKSDCLAGLDDAAASRLDKKDPDWRTNGKRGVVQLIHGG